MLPVIVTFALVNMCAAAWAWVATDFLTKCCAKKIAGDVPSCACCPCVPPTAPAGPAVPAADDSTL